MTNKQIIKLKQREDLNEKIIKEKGNTKCIFYSDDICRKGDKTRDCVNCARVEYHSLYSLNWDNQERLQKIIKQKEQECQQAMDNYVQLDLQRVKEYNELVDLYKAKEQECEELKREIAFGNNGKLSDKIRAIVFKDLNAENSKYKQTLDKIEEYFKSKDKRNTSLFNIFIIEQEILAIINQTKENN